MATEACWSLLGPLGLSCDREEGLLAHRCGRGVLGLWEPPGGVQGGMRRGSNGQEGLTGVWAFLVGGEAPGFAYMRVSNLLARSLYLKCST